MHAFLKGKIGVSAARQGGPGGGLGTSAAESGWGGGGLLTSGKWGVSQGVPLSKKKRLLFTTFVRRPGKKSNQIQTMAML